MIGLLQKVLRALFLRAEALFNRAFGDRLNPYYHLGSLAFFLFWIVAGTGANPAAAADFAGGAFPTGTVSFAAGETTKTVTVNVAGDTAIESSEGFLVSLSAPSSGTLLGTASATGSILIGTVLDELERRDLKRGLVTMCAAGGMAPAIIIERV